MKNFTLLFFAFFVVHFGYSQHPQPGIMPPFSMEDFKYEKTPVKFTGSPYLEENFSVGTISDENGNSLKAEFRYNAVEDIVEIKIQNSDKTEIRVLPKVKEISYSLDNYKIIYDSFVTNKGEELKGYLIEYYNGDSYALYGKTIPKVSPGYTPNTSYQTYKPAHLDVQVTYYLKKDDGTLYPVELRDKDFRNVLPKDHEFNNYMADNKLKTPQDYAEMLKWYESISIEKNSF